MKKNAAFSVVAILLCFLIGYTAYEATSLVVSLFQDRLANCQPDTGVGCPGNSSELRPAGSDR